MQVAQRWILARLRHERFFSLAALNAQIKALEARYPNGMPPDVYASYSALVDRFNAGVATERSQVAAYNTLLAQSNGVIGQLNGLLC